MGSDSGGHLRTAESEQAGFRYTVEAIHKATHITIPRPNPNLQAYVESSHNLIELEYYDIEYWIALWDFYEKATTYQNYFNLARKNSYKGWKTPLEILQECGVERALGLLLLPPVDLATLRSQQVQGGTMHLSIPPCHDGCTNALAWGRHDYCPAWELLAP